MRLLRFKAFLFGNKRITKNQILLPQNPKYENYKVFGIGGKGENID